MIKDNSKPVRVRFAPSPTGHLHIGSLRTALFNWLFARRYNGTFIVRIEDTDTERSEQKYIDSIHAALDWSGLVSDEPVVLQSDRATEYAKTIQKLLENGSAYRCYCSNEEIIGRHNERYGGDDLYVVYDGHCRSVDQSDNDKKHVIRFAVPRGQKSIIVDDLIRGQVTFDLSTIDDFIIVRSDGRPVYNFVVVVDDASMNISHVIRGEDHISNTPKQMLLHKACGFDIPDFAHLPLILGPSGDRLSKRDAATSVLEYKDVGYLPQALLNYLVRLGWAHGDQEIFSMQEMCDFFSLQAIGKKGSIFDIIKLNWVNAQYLKEMHEEDLCAYITNFIKPNFLHIVQEWPRSDVLTLIRLYKERVDTVSELVDLIYQFYSAPILYEPADVEKCITPEIIIYLQQLIEVIAGMPDFVVDLIKKEMKQFCIDNNIKLGQLAQPIRIALVGKAASPGIFELMAVLGQEECCIRLSKMLNTIA